MKTDMFVDHPFLTVKGYEQVKIWQEMKGRLENKIALGYWWTEEEPHLPHPRDFVDVMWARLHWKDCEAIVSYLDAGKTQEQWRGNSWCRFGCKYLEGTNCLTDGVYVWPEAFSHYVMIHAVKPPDEFIEHVLAKSLRQVS